MSVLAVLEVAGGKVKKTSYEAAYYASKVAETLGTEAVAVLLGEASADELSNLGNYGVRQIWHCNDAKFHVFDSKAHARAVEEAVAAAKADVVILSFNPNGKLLAPRLAVRLKAGYVPGASSLPEVSGAALNVVKNVFSGKAKATYSVATEKKVIAISPNSFSPVKGSGTATVNAFSPSSAEFGVTVKSVNKAEGEISLTEADIVVSAGRGLKGPENWGMIEELAKELGAATACSRPVADVDWRPHHEHVGQTGFTVKPNLYIAIGISGAIQHLAGVNQSKVIVVINSDPEAPFFKAADYGIVGDAFQVVPKLIEEVKKYHASAH
ncbi:MAG: electron transfer flavoprotein subunit alpha/FixB family protein [Chitinophagales bacterium]